MSGRYSVNIPPVFSCLLPFIFISSCLNYSPQIWCINVYQGIKIREHIFNIQETCKVVDAVNKDSPLERRELPVVFIKEYEHVVPALREYPERDIPPLIEPGTLMWWTIDSVFEEVINPGYAWR